MTDALGRLPCPICDGAGSRALDAATDLLERITFDSDGVMVGMVRQGGNGGIISNETLRAADALRRALDDLAGQDGGAD